MKIILFSLTLITSINLFGQRTLIPYRIGDKWGLANFYEEFVIEPKYEEVMLFSDQISPTITDKSLARVKLNGLYGFVNESGQEVITPIYEKASDFNNGYALVEKDNEKFVIDGNNNIVSDSLYQPQELLPNYDVCIPLEALSPIDMNSWKKIFKDLGCEEVLPIKGNDMGFLIRNGEKWGAVHYEQLWVPMEYDSIHPYAISNSSGLSYILYRNGKQGLCVRFEGGTPPTITETEYNEIKIVKRHGYSGQLYWYKKNGYWGFIDSRNKFIEPKYLTLDLNKERNFLYEVTTSDGAFGYYLISLNKEYFKDKQPPTIDEIKPSFIEAETYANKYIKQSFSGLDLDKLVKDMEDCLQSGMNAEIDDKKNIYYNFCLNQGINIFKLDTSLLSSIANAYYDNNIIIQDAINISPNLISTCHHLDSKFADLIEKYPDYPFSQIVKSFKVDIINETSPSLINSAMSHVFDDCDFDTEFYQKVVLLQNFYGFVYFYLVDKGKLDSPLRK